MAEYIVARIKGTIALTGGRAFFVPAGLTNGEMTMANKIENVTRRNFMNGTAGAIATSGAALLSNGEAQADTLELEQVARALHQTVGRYSDRNAPIFSEPHLPPRNPSLDFAMENLRYWSIDEIQHLLKPLFEGRAS